MHKEASSAVARGRIWVGAWLTQQRIGVLAGMAELGCRGDGRALQDGAGQGTCWVVGRVPLPLAVPAVAVAG